jgi:hypothetical protein
MTTVSTTTTFSLPAGQVVCFLVGGRGTATVDPTGRGNIYTIGQQESFIGPFTKAVNILVTPESTINYRIDSDGNLDDQTPPLNRALMLSGDGLTLAGNSLTPSQAAQVRAGMGSTQVAKIKSAIAAAKNNNPQVLAPWSAAPTWAISTTYGSGQIVRGTAGNAGNLYLMAGSDATASHAVGASAGSGAGPTGTGTDLIVDNTCRWLYIGKASSTGTLPFLATSTPSTPTDDMTGFVALVNSATATAIGLTAYVPADFSTEAFVSGGRFADRNAGRVNGPNQGTFASPSYTAGSERGSIKFVTNARKWIALRPSGDVFPQICYDIIVNGRHLSESPFVRGTTAAGVRFLLNLAPFGDGLKEVEIRVYNDLKALLAHQIELPADAAIWPAENACRYKMTFEGDSITWGEYIGKFKSRFWFERIVGDFLGCDHVYNNAVGGTGAIDDVSGTKTTYIQRLSDVVAFGSDVHYIGGFRNDDQFTSGERQAAILAYLQACRAAMPGTILAVIGAHVMAGDNLASGQIIPTVEADAKAAFDAFNDANSVFIPILGATRALITSSANGQFFLNTGSAPYNDLHPLPSYYRFIGGVVAQKIAAFVAGLD